MVRGQPNLTSTFATETTTPGDGRVQLLARRRQSNSPRGPFRLSDEEDGPVRSTNHSLRRAADFRPESGPSLVAEDDEVGVDLVESVVPESDFRQLRDQLPESDDEENWQKLFEVVDAGGWSEAE